MWPWGGSQPRVIPLFRRNLVRTIVNDHYRLSNVVLRLPGWASPRGRYGLPASPSWGELAASSERLAQAHATWKRLGWGSNPGLQDSRVGAPFPQPPRAALGDPKKKKTMRSGAKHGQPETSTASVLLTVVQGL